jgi:nicotinate-nucleotide adenylyltransferase
MARTALRELGLDEVIFVPAGAPHKAMDEDTSLDHRLGMTRAAVNPLDRVSVSPVERYRPWIQYTVDTMKALIEIRPANYTFIMGMDAFKRLGDWYQIEKLARLCGFAVFIREEGERGAGAVRGDMDRMADDLRGRYGADITIMKDAPPAISSGMLRDRARLGLSIERYVPQGVQDYIDQERLYNPPRMISRDEMVRVLEGMLSPRRFKHSLAVERKAVELARLHHVPVGQAALAGLLHDCAKDIPADAMRREADRLGILADEATMAKGGLLHAAVGAALLRELFGVTDPEIIRAVRRHTTGCAGMSALDLVIYVADKIEDEREDYPGLIEMRNLAHTSLTDAAIICMRNTISYVYANARGLPAHPDTQAALDSLMEADTEGE